MRYAAKLSLLHNAEWRTLVERFLIGVVLASATPAFVLNFHNYSDADAMTSVIKFAGSCSYRTGVRVNVPSPCVI